MHRNTLSLPAACARCANPGNASRQTGPALRARLPPDEVQRIKIEVSRLSSPVPLEYDSPEQLPDLLEPGIDGVVLSTGNRSATFLPPQVWEQLPEPEQFLSPALPENGLYSQLLETQHAGS